MGKKIRDAEIAKNPYIVVVGEKEEIQNRVTVIKHVGEDIGMVTI